MVDRCGLEFLTGRCSFPPACYVANMPNDKLVCYLDGKVTLSDDYDGGFSNWTADQVVFGQDLAGERSWRGRILAVALGHRSYNAAGPPNGTRPSAGGSCLPSLPRPWRGRTRASTPAWMAGSSVRREGAASQPTRTARRWRSVRRTVHAAPFGLRVEHNGLKGIDDDAALLVGVKRVFP